MNPRRHRRVLSPPQGCFPWHPASTIGTGEAAQLLGCSTQTVRRLIADGALDSRRHSGQPHSHLLVVYDSVLRVLEEYRTAALRCSPEAAAASAPLVAAVAPAPETVAPHE